MIFIMIFVRATYLYVLLEIQKGALQVRSVNMLGMLKLMFELLCPVFQSKQDQLMSFSTSHCAIVLFDCVMLGTIKFVFDCFELIKTNGIDVVIFVQVCCAA